MQGWGAQCPPQQGSCLGLCQLPAWPWGTVSVGKRFGLIRAPVPGATVTLSQLLTPTRSDSPNAGRRPRCPRERREWPCCGCCRVPPRVRTLWLKQFLSPVGFGGTAPVHSTGQPGRVRERVPADAAVAVPEAAIPGILAVWAGTGGAVRWLLGGSSLGMPRCCGVREQGALSQRVPFGVPWPCAGSE